MTALTDRELARLDFTRIHEFALQSPADCCSQYLLASAIQHIGDLLRLQLWIWPGGIIRKLSGNRMQCSAYVRERTKNRVVYHLIIGPPSTGRQEYNTGEKLNQLRRENIPNFIYTYYYIEGGAPLVIDEQIYAWFFPIKEVLGKASYLAVEAINETEEGTTLLQYLSKQDGKLARFSELSSLFLQCFAALAEANKLCGLTHDHICPQGQTIMVRTAGDLANEWITYQRLGVKVCVFGNLPIIGNLHRAVGKGSVIYDLYYLVVLFANAISNKLTFPGVRQFSQFLVELLAELNVPQWYITNIDLIECPVCCSDEERKVIFPPDIIETTYDQIRSVIIKLRKKYDLDELIQFMVPIKARGDFCSFDKVVSYCDDEDDKLLTATYCPSEEDYPLDQIFSNYDMVTSKLKTNLEGRYGSIDVKKKKLGILSLPDSPPKNLVEQVCTLHIELFTEFLQQKISLDQLDCILYCSCQIRPEGSIEDQNLQNYINEHHARILRLVGECSDIYDDSKYLLPWEQWHILERVHYILTSKPVRTR